MTLLRMFAFTVGCLASLLCIVNPVFAEQSGRYALIIANEKYTEKVGRLHNPHEDAGLIRRALISVGFPEDQIEIVKDASRGEMLAAVERYARRLSGGGDDAVGFFYYSGHGTAKPNTDGNYLIPVTVKDALSAELWYDAVSLERIRELLREHAPRAAHIVVFDACRNELQSGERGGKGFVAMREWGGMLIAYSTAPGKTASDGVRNAAGGPYAQVLAAELETAKGISAPELFARVRIKMRERPERQSPWFLHGLDRQVHFGTRPPLSEVATVWANVKETTDISIMKAFRVRFGSEYPIYDELAAHRIEELEKATASTDKLETQDTPPQVVDTSLYAIAIQSELKRIGCYVGEIDGKWGPESKAAYDRVEADKNIGVSEPALSSANLDRLRKVEAPLCNIRPTREPARSSTRNPPSTTPKRNQRSAERNSAPEGGRSTCYQRAQRYCSNPDNSSAIGYMACMTQAKKGCRDQ